jgi:hypothetical protein
VPPLPSLTPPCIVAPSLNPPRAAGIPESLPSFDGSSAQWRFFGAIRDRAEHGWSGTQVRGVRRRSWQRARSWRDEDAEPCAWPGVICTDGGGGRVVAVELGNASLTGYLLSELSLHSELQTLSLPYNRLSGHIPVVVAALQTLTTVYLMHNLLSGQIPAGIGWLLSLSRFRPVIEPAEQMIWILVTPLISSTDLMRISCPDFFLLLNTCCC